MQRHLFLHIGLPKTGTSAIQSFLAAERKALAAQNIYFPDTLDDERHSMLVRAIGGVQRQDPQSGIWRGEDPGVALQAYIDGFTTDLAAMPRGVTKVILSAEQFSRFKADEPLIRLRDLLTPYFDSMRIVAYLRRQDNFFASFYTQTLRLGVIEPPDVTALLKQYEGYDYAEILTRWARVFGEDAIVPRLFERGPDRKFDVLEDFASVCGFTVPDTSRARSKDANPAISLAAQHALLLLGAKLQDLLGSQRVNGNAWHRICYNVTGVAAGQGWQPTREEARGLVAHFAASNEAVRARWFKDRPSLFNDDFDFLPEQPVQPDPGQVLDVMAAAFASATQNGIRREQELRVEKALLMDEMGEPDKAMDLLATALRHDGRDVSARLNLAKLQIQSGAFRKARVNVDAALELEPNNKMGQRLLQRLLKRTNEETEV
jgi:hypothetical protein